MFSEKLQQLAFRESPMKLTKMKLQDENAIPKWEKVRKIKDYDYYICDYCSEEIRISDKWNELEGGIVEIPFNLYNKNKIVVALHNKCLNQMINKINDEKMIEENINHISI